MAESKVETIAASATEVVTELTTKASAANATEASAETSAEASAKASAVASEEASAITSAGESVNVAITEKSGNATQVKEETSIAETEKADQTKENSDLKAMSDTDRCAQLKQMNKDIASRFPSLSHISSEEIMKIYDISSMKLLDSKKDEGYPENLILVDCRSIAEQRVSVIRNAITQNQFEKQYIRGSALKDKADELKSSMVVPYCTVGLRSAKFCNTIAEKGVQNLKNLDGILLWIHSGGEVTGKKNKDGIDATKQVHTFSKKMALAPESYKTKSFSPLHIALKLFWI